jgi:hypothetical protein
LVEVAAKQVEQALTENASAVSEGVPGNQQAKTERDGARAEGWGWSDPESGMESGERVIIHEDFADAFYEGLRETETEEDARTIVEDLASLLLFHEMIHVNQGPGVLSANGGVGPECDAYSKELELIDWLLDNKPPFNDPTGQNNRARALKSWGNYVLSKVDEHC